MSRPLRIAYQGAVYHVMNRGQNRQNIFTSALDYQKFLNILKDSVERWDLQIHAVSLMPNHYHLLIETPQANISRAMRHIGAVYTQWFNNHYLRDGALFRGRFKAVLVDEPAYLVELLRYIHLNPVKAGLAKNPQDHPWTSHQAYTRTLRSWNWLKTDRLLRFFGRDLKSSRTQLQKFVQAGVPEQLQKRLDSRRWPSVFSSKTFEELVQWNFGSQIENREITYRPLHIKKLEINTIKKIICEALDCSWSDIAQPSGRRHKQYRYIAIASIQKELRLKHIDLEQHLPNLIPSTVSRAQEKALRYFPEEWHLINAQVQNAKSKI